jgi:type II secretory pathway pseudopilin PulG
MSNDAAKTVFNTLILDIGTVGGYWEAYLWRMGEAYTDAYNSQKNLLKGIRDNIKLAQAAEEANRTLILSFVTAGVGGLIASQLTKQIQKAAIQDAAGQTFQTAKAALKAASSDDVLGEVVGHVEKGLEIAKNIATTAAGDPTVKQNIEGLQQAIGIKAAGVSQDGYTPPGVPPEKYISALQGGQQERINVLKAAMTYLRSTGWFSEQGAIAIDKNVRQSDFFLKAPPPAMEPGTKAIISRKAKLATWIAWALPRPRDWWERQNVRQSVGQNGEIPLWTPLLNELIVLGVPINKIMMKGVEFHRSWTSSEIKQTVHLNMVGFIDWARSRDAFIRLFGDNVDPQGLKWVDNHWPKLQKATK